MYERLNTRITTAADALAIEQQARAEKEAEAARQVFDNRYDEDAPNKYMRVIKVIEVAPSEVVQFVKVEVDVYDVLNAFPVNCPAMHNAGKKILAAGTRGYKDSLQDKNEAINCIKRSIEMEQQRMLLASDE